MSKKKVSARAIIEQLRLLHSKDENQWAVFAELRAGTGYDNQQRIDLFAMNLYPSNNFRSIAYEVKISRADFVNEIKKPKKRKFAESVAHECYFAVPHAMITSDEVPEGWGLYEINAAGPRRTKIALQRDSVTWGQSFVASIARRSADDPPTLPVEMWRVAGREINADELIELTKTLQADAVESAVRTARATERERFRNSPEFKAMEALWLSARKHLGYHRNMTEVFEAAIADGGLDTIQAKTMRFDQHIDDAIESLKRLRMAIHG
jgi:hypothetical protein